MIEPKKILSMSHVKKFKDISFLFITGIEGSGTTMMLKLLDAVEGVAVLGGNYWAPELDKEAQILNKLTENLWDEKKSYSLPEKEKIFRKIRELELPSHYTRVVHKRSFPFLDMHHFPHLSDCRQICRDAKILNMRRNHVANTRSILRRNFETDQESAAKRTEVAVRRLEMELGALDVGGVMHIDYESVIDINKKDELLGELADFINMERGLLKRNSHIITGPAPVPGE